MLKPVLKKSNIETKRQPPSGGCVLKLTLIEGFKWLKYPAAFGRLCVETKKLNIYCRIPCPAAFGRLCVETS